MAYVLGPPAAPSAIEAAESRLDERLPDQVSLFYQVMNGFEVPEPPIRILALENLERLGGAIRFSVIDRVHSLAFDVSELNAAGQWTVRNEADGYAVTRTFASFWSNKIWAWIDKRRPIWRREFDVDRNG